MTEEKSRRRRRRTTTTMIYPHGDNERNSKTTAARNYETTMKDKREVINRPYIETTFLIGRLRPSVDSTLSVISLIFMMAALITSNDVSSSAVTSPSFASTMTSSSSSSSSSAPSLSASSTSSTSPSLLTASSSSPSTSTWQIAFFRSEVDGHESGTSILLCQYSLINEAELLINCDNSSSSSNILPPSITPSISPRSTGYSGDNMPLNFKNMADLIQARISLITNLETLTIRSVPLRSVNLGAILFLAQTEGVKRLDLSMNSIERLFSNATKYYDGLDSKKKLQINFTFPLITLDLSRNKLMNVERDSFRHLEHLQVLDLSYNALVTLDGLLFSGLASMNELRLSNNLLSSLPDAFLINCPHLELLDLSGNSVVEISGFVFENNSALKVLIISKNKFSKFPTSAVSKLKRLEYLDFGGNPARRLESESVAHLRNLRELKINFMPELEIVEANSFHNLPRLVAIFMSDNKKLAYLDPAAFTSCARINDLHLQNNKMVTVSEEFIKGFGELQFLDISNNHLTCDCNLVWLAKVLHRCLVDTNAPYLSTPDSPCPRWVRSVTSHHPLVCHSPSHLVGQLLIEALGVEDEPQSTTISHQSPTKSVQHLCSPLIAPLFTRAIHLAAGESLYLECRSLGAVRVNASWHFTGLGSRNHPDGFDDSINNSPTNIINVSNVVPHHAGLYSCAAQGEGGIKQTSNVTVKIFNRNATVYPTSLSRTSVTVEWTGTETTMNTADYYLTCRRMIDQKINFVPAEHHPINRVRRQSGKYFHPSSLFAKHAKPYSTSPRPPQPLHQSTNDHTKSNANHDSDHHTYLHQYPPYLTGEAASLAYVKIRLGPYMRRNTFNGLQPMTPYMICIAVCNSTERRPTNHHHYHTDLQRAAPAFSNNDKTTFPFQVDEEDGELITLSCFQITTSDKNLPGYEQEPGIRKLPILQILLGVFGSLALTLTCCVICRNLATSYAERVGRRRKCRGDDYKLVACRSELCDSSVIQQPAETVFIEKTKSLSRTSLLED